MKLKAKVTAVESGSGYSDGVQRIRLKFEDCESHYRELIIPNHTGLELDDTVEMEVNLTVVRTPLSSAPWEELIVADTAGATFRFMQQRPR